MFLTIPTNEEVEFIDKSLMTYNEMCEPFTQTVPFISINRCLKKGDSRSFSHACLLACVIY